MFYVVVLGLVMVNVDWLLLLIILVILEIFNRLFLFFGKGVISIFILLFLFKLVVIFYNVLLDEMYVFLLFVVYSFLLKEIMEESLMLFGSFVMDIGV